MIQFVELNYDDAKLLSDGGALDIFVFEPDSGDVFKFSDYDWIWAGSRAPFEELLKANGILGLDMHYVYFWIKFMKEKE